jgi:hypothetical protein
MSLKPLYIDDLSKFSISEGLGQFLQIPYYSIAPLSSEIKIVGYPL